MGRRIARKTVDTRGYAVGREAEDLALARRQDSEHVAGATVAPLERSQPQRQCRRDIALSPESVTGRPPVIEPPR
jgi:hypothetical protein